MGVERENFLKNTSMEDLNYSHEKHRSDTNYKWAKIHRGEQKEMSDKNRKTTVLIYLIIT